MSLITILGFVLGILLGVFLSYIIIISRIKQNKFKEIKENEEKAKRILEDASREADKIKKEAELNSREQFLTLKSDLEKNYNERQSRLNNFERRLLQREETIEKRASTLENREKELHKQEHYLKNKEREVDNLKKRHKEIIEEEIQQLHKIAQMTPEEAKKQILLKVEEESQSEIAKLLKKVEEDYVRRKEVLAKEVMATAIQSNAADYVIESTVSVVDLPSDDMKGRIIGREGRNIRALETQTGTNLIIDDTPEAVIISSADPIRREMARRALQRLVEDGRINPARIEEVIADTKKKFEQSLIDEGEAVVLEFGLKNVHPELIKLLGKLRYRTSYGQNVLEHSKEVAAYAGKMAAEIGANIEIATRGGLLHDIGKAIDREVEGTHLELGVKLARKYGESEEVIQVIASHHQDMNFPSIEAMLVQAADTLSAARPGVRREILEVYLKRLENLENLASSFDGVAKAYALQAGREVRIIVNADKVYDEEAIILARKIASKIEDELEYPGQIKVTVVREKRIVEFAR
jgi:ribonuclease Y